MAGLSISAGAQNARTYFGGFGGASASTFINGSETAERRTSSVFGASLVRETTERVALELNLQLVRKGASYPFTAAREAYRLDYLEIPFLARFAPLPGSAVRPIFSFGPTISLRLSCNATLTLAGTAQKFDCSKGSDYQVVDLGYTGGIALALDAKDTRFTVGVRFTQGLGEIFDGTEFRNAVVSAIGGISIPIF